MSSLLITIFVIMLIIIIINIIITYDFLEDIQTHHHGNYHNEHNHHCYWTYQHHFHWSQPLWTSTALFSLSPWNTKKWYIIIVRSFVWHFYLIFQVFQQVEPCPAKPTILPLWSLFDRIWNTVDILQTVSQQQYCTKKWFSSWKQIKYLSLNYIIYITL